MYCIARKVNPECGEGYIFYQFSSDETDLWGHADNIESATKYTKKQALRLSKSPLMDIRGVKFYEIGYTLLNSL